MKIKENVIKNRMDKIIQSNIKRIIETLEKQRLSYIRRTLSRDSEESAYFRGTKKLSELVIISLKSALDYSKK